MNIVDKIKFEEGDKASAYKCPANKWTIGAGINLEQQTMPLAVMCLWEFMGMNYGPKWMLSLFDGGEMPKNVRDMWLSVIIDENEEIIESSFNSEYGVYFQDLPDDARLVIQDMAYQMGVSGMLNFQNMLTAISRGLYVFAAEHLLDSNYARQTPERANRNAKLLRGCERVR
jgi:lysozyme